jgi:cytochrome c
MLDPAARNSGERKGAMRQLAVLGALVLLVPSVVCTQMPIPPAEPPDGAKLFRAQCATCHSLSAADPPRQGPNLAHVIGRKIGSVEGYKFTPGYREADAAWDPERLDKYLTNPQAMFPGSIMAYRQSNPNTRKAIIDYLREQG